MRPRDKLQLLPQKKLHPGDGCTNLQGLWQPTCSAWQTDLGLQYVIVCLLCAQVASPARPRRPAKCIGECLFFTPSLTADMLCTAEALMCLCMSILQRSTAKGLQPHPIV